MSIETGSDFSVWDLLPSITLTLGKHWSVRFSWLWFFVIWSPAALDCFAMWRWLRQERERRQAYTRAYNRAVEQLPADWSGHQIMEVFKEARRGKKDYRDFEAATQYTINLARHVQRVTTPAPVVTDGKPLRKYINWDAREESEK